MAVPTTVTVPAVGDKATAAWAGIVAGDINTTHGCRATTNATQAIAASTTTNLNNGGTAAWTATEDTDSYVSATGGTTAPITIPTGLGGLYLVGVHYQQAANSASRLFSGILVNGATGTLWFPGYGEALTNGAVPMRLTAGTTLGMLGFTATATNISVGCQIFAYWLGF